jgi:glycosyltransferase involved in cell wall biosynthesis
MRIALVDPYLGGSHLAWADGFSKHSSHDVEVFGLPALFWKWRMQGGHVTLAAAIEEAVDSDGPFDLVLATSTTNLPALLGQARRSLGAVPAVLYMHENQLTYPLSPLDREDLTYAMINWTSMAAAERVLFNSEFHRSAWFEALPTFLGRFPDERHTHLIETATARSQVLPVGVDLTPIDAHPRDLGDLPLVLWNQRWEFDKGPADFANALVALLDEGVDFDVALAGERYGDEPPEFTDLRERLGERLVHDDHADLDTYRALLRRADVVVSTAHQEFFGIAVTEAIYAGAFPVLPDRLVYPERIPDEFHALCLYTDDAALVERLRWALHHRTEAAAIAAAVRPAMAACDWSVTAPKYDATLGEVAEAAR